MANQTLQIQHLEQKLKVLAPGAEVPVPPTGWIKAIRGALGISLQQLANKLSMTKQSARELELREKEGTVTLKSLRDAARALDMQLVYGFVPRDGSLDALITRKAHELATRIVERTSNTMKLEDQENSEKRIENAIAERTNQLKQTRPKILWD